MSANQYKNLTTSNNGLNVMPLLQPQSHFFLQVNRFTKIIANSFGVVSIGLMEIQTIIKN